MDVKEIAKLARRQYADYEESQDLALLDEAISTMRGSIALAPNSTNRTRLCDLGYMLSSRFRRLGKLEDIDEAISMQLTGVERMPDGYSAKLRRTSDLVLSLGLRFEHLGKVEDIEEAISLLNHATEMASEDDRDRPLALNNLGNAYRSRFLRLGELGDLESALSVQRLAVDLLKEDDPDKPSMLSNLATFLQMRSERLGAIADLENAISLQRRAIELAADDEPRIPAWLNNLSDSLQNRFERIGDSKDLENAIRAQQEAVDATADDELEKPVWLDSLGVALQLRFERQDNVRDLECAITAHRNAVDLTPDDHSSKPVFLGNLGSALQIRFVRHGELEDLENAISAKRLAVNLTPDDHSQRAERFANLGNSLQTRFYRLGEVSDLEAAIEAKQLSVSLTPDQEIRKLVRLISLSGAQHARFECLQRPDDLESAISTAQLVVKRTRNDDPEQPARLNALGCYLRSRCNFFYDLHSLEHAIKVHRLAVDLTPPDHPDKALWHNNLGTALYELFQHTGKVEDLDHAIAAYAAATQLSPDGHADKPVRQLNYAISLYSRFMRDPTPIHFEDTIDQFKHATTQSLGHPYVRLDSAVATVELLSGYPALTSPHALLRAHSQVMSILPEVVWLGYSVNRRYEETAKLGDAVNSAVSAAIRFRALSEALEWLETGRSFVWSQILSLRLPYNDLREYHPNLAKELQDVSEELRRTGNVSHFSSTRDDSLNSSPLSFMVTDQAADRHRHLVIQYDRILADVRSRPGFEEFLHPPKRSKLMSMIEHADGLVVFINVHSTSCDALALSPDGTMIAIPLPGLTEQRAHQLRSLWMQNLEWCNTRVRGAARPDIVVRGNSTIFGRVLTRLWTWIVHPILLRLDLIKNQAVDRLQPHITWCPTGLLSQVPLHAAGVYDSSQDYQPRVYDFVVSSYSPSLSALLRCLQTHDAGPGRQPNVLIVAQPATPGLSRLPGTLKECARLRSLLPQTAYTSLEHEQAIVNRTLGLMGQHAWAHFACHGMQDMKDPTQSSFALYDGRLTLSALMRTTAESAELAFLSACQTAVGDEKVPEESVHLAAGMLAAGFKGVVATMWSIGDAEAPIVVEAYYRNLIELRDSGAIRRGSTGAAYALHEAVKTLRTHVGENNFVKWAPFVHFGI